VTESGREGLAVLNTFNRFTPPGAFSPQNTDSFIVNNDISGNGVSVVITDAEVGQLGGDGIFVRCYMNSPPQGCGTRTTIQANRVTNNPAHGIALGKSQGNIVRGNLGVGNGFGSMTSYASDPPYTDGFDLNVDPACDNNTWLGNTFGTVNQPCVRHHQLSVVQDEVVREPLDEGHDLLAETVLLPVDLRKGLRQTVLDLHRASQQGASELVIVIAHDT